MKILTTLIIAFIILLTAIGCNKSSSVEPPDKQVMNAFEKAKNLSSFYSSASVTDISSGKVTDTRVEFFSSQPDKFWAKISENIGSMESMGFAKEYYAKDDTHHGVWYRSEEPAEAIQRTRSLLGFDRIKFDKLDNITYVGQDTFNKKRVLIYQYRNQIGPGAAEKVWVSAESGLPVKIDIWKVREGDFVTINFDYEKKIDLKPPVIE